MGRHASIIRRHKKWGGRLAVGLLWLFALSFTALTVRAVFTDEPPKPVDGAAAPQRSLSTPSSTDGPDESGSTSAPSRVVGPAAGPPDAGPGITTPGVLLVLTPGSAGTFQVTETARFADPVYALTLSPPALDDAGAPFRNAEPVATSVHLTAGGQHVDVPGEVVEDEVEVSVGGILQYELTYRLEGATVHMLPSVQGRALTAASPLLRNTNDLPVAVAVSGPVLGLSCPLLPLSSRACGQGSADQMWIDPPLRFDQAVVTVQFDLPAA